GSEHDTAVGPLRRTGAALTGPAGALLSPGLSAAAGNLSAGQSGLGALTQVGQVVLDHIMDNRLVGSNAENSFGQFDLANLLAGHIVNLSKHDLRSPFLSLLQKPSGDFCRKPSAGSC